ncbi:MAG: hypothetical protein JW719_07970 [Pirellulales bacterium]|nr:hypothetical protein [Pirellulales bacterium]
MRGVSIHISKYIFGTKKERPLGDTSCTVTSLSTDIPVRLRLKLTPFHEERDVTPEFIDGLYSGRDLWNLNPTQQVRGHFRLPIDLNGVPFIYRVEIRWSIVDIHEREHKMLPFSYVWNDPSSDWWFDPKVLT